MTSFDNAQRAYIIDPTYHQLVDMLVALIEKLEMTPSEVRQAAVFACIIFQERSVHPMSMMADDAQAVARAAIPKGATIEASVYDFSAISTGCCKGEIVERDGKFILQIKE